ncbi:hypothetical protein Tco_1273431 [Tanacetum coccineum]
MDEPNNPITRHPTTPQTIPPQPNTPPSHSSTPIPPQPDTHPSHSSTPIPTSTQIQSHAQTVDSHTPIPINNSSQTMPTHPMVTHAKAGIFKLLERMNCHVTTTSPLSLSHVHALRDPNWKRRFPAQSVGSSNTNVLDLPCLLVLITRKSQADKHDDTSLIHYKNLASHLPRACLMLAQAGFPFVIVNTKEYHSECSGRITRIMRRTLVNSL